MGDLSTNFSRDEFLCNCGCGLYIPNPELVEKLQKIRSNIGLPMIILSGTRCATRNKLEHGRKNSAHLTGEGADARCLDSTRRRIMVESAMVSSFSRIGIAMGFIHLDVSRTLPQDVLWLY